MRLAGWQSALAAHVADWQGRAFKWGTHDCALFTARGVKVMTGVDLSKGMRGYRSETDGLRKAQARGFRDHVDVFRQSLPAATRLRVGDVAVIDVAGQRAVGLVTGRGIHCMAEPKGLRHVPLDWAVEGFAV